MAMRHAYQQANNQVSSSSDRKVMICGGSTLRVDVLMLGRRWKLWPSLTRRTKPNWSVQRVQPSHSGRHR